MDVYVHDFFVNKPLTTCRHVGVFSSMVASTVGRLAMARASAHAGGVAGIGRGGLIVLSLVI
jgi:hypothetical protein